MQSKGFSRYRGVRPAALCVVALVVAACGSSSAARAGGPAVKIVSPAPRTVVQGNVVTLQLNVTGITLVKADGDTTGATGHLHVFIDRDPVPVGAVIPTEPDIVHTASNPVKIPGLSAGSHRFSVVLGDGTHQRIASPAAETTVTVNGPTLQATAPGTVPRGTPVTITVSVIGVSLVPADGDTSGKTGHLHLFVDKEPTAAGQAIPKTAGIIHTAETSVNIRDLSPGEHVIWVVLGNGAHIPLDPPVEDKVTVIVQ